MKKFTKTTVGFVTQTFEQDSEGRFICTHQEFIAGDQCDYEDSAGEPIDPPEHEYQPFNMALRNETACHSSGATVLSEAYEAIEEVLNSLDVGGEQSRQFADEIRILRRVIGRHRAIDGAFGKEEGLDLIVSRRELATILAALRFHQAENLKDGFAIPDKVIKDIATDGSSLKPLDLDGVDRLCEKVNTCGNASSGLRRKNQVLIFTDQCTVVRSESRHPGD